MEHAMKILRLIAEGGRDNFNRDTVAGKFIEVFRPRLRVLPASTYTVTIITFFITYS